MIQKKSKIMEVVYYMYMNWKKELRSKSAPVSVYTFKDNKILTVDRNDMFISEIIGTLVYLHFMIKQFKKKRYF
jgi:hypothetical protein